jgi:hypothetical protein
MKFAHRQDVVAVNGGRRVRWRVPDPIQIAAVEIVRALAPIAAPLPALKVVHLLLHVMAALL